MDCGNNLILGSGSREVKNARKKIKSWRKNLST